MILQRPSRPFMVLSSFSTLVREQATFYRAALRPIADDHESPAVVARLLGIVTDDFTNGCRNAKDTITLLGQMRDNVAMSDALREALHPFGIQNMLASVGAKGSIEDVEARLKAWLVTR